MKKHATTTACDPATTFVTNDEMAVEYDTGIADDQTSITIRRTVWNKPKAGPRKAVILHQETLAVLGMSDAIHLVGELALALAFAQSPADAPAA